MQKKIKIAYIIDKLNVGGTEKQLLKTIELLDNNEFEPILICLRLSEYYSRFEIPCEKYGLNVFSLMSVQGLLKFFWLMHYLRKEKVDIVQTYFFDATVFGVLAAKFAGVKRIISCRRDLGFWYKPTLLRVLKCVDLLVDRFLVNSHAVKENIVVNESIPPRNIDVIYNGIDSEPFKKSYNTEAIKRNLGISEGDYVVGMIANLNRRVKRVDLFIKAASKVQQKTQNISFVIVGDGNQRSVFERLSKKLNIRDRVFFAGLQENVYPYLSAFDIGVISSDSEGFSNSILEYLASGIPVIATDVGGNRELIESGITGLLVPRGDHEALAKSILELLNDEDQRANLAQKAKRVVIEKYAWDKKIKEIESYYLSLLKD